MVDTLIQTAFVGGELAPNLYGRADIGRRFSSVKVAKNFYVLPYGGLENRTGTRYVAEVKDSSKAVRLIPFVFNSEQQYIIELGEGYGRFCQNGAQVTNGGTPEEISLPYQEDELFEITFIQSADVLTLFHPDYQPREIRRVDATNFSVATFDNTEGPFKDLNVDEAVVITASAETGTGITLTASSGAPFTSSDVGDLFYLEQADTGDLGAWQNRQEVTAIGDRVYVDERVYEATAFSGPTIGDTLTGDNTPFWIEGEQWDGPRESVQGITETLGFKWQYLHSGFGIVRITGFTDSQTVTADVISRIPGDVTSTGTSKWAKAAWGNTEGWPATGTYYQQRLVTANTLGQPQTLWFSETGIFDSFKQSNPIIDSDAFNITISSRQINEIRHLVPLGTLLAITAGSEWTISAASNTGIAPGNVEVQAQNYRGSSQVEPLLIGNTALYVQARGSIVRDLTYSFDVDGYTGTDLTLFANHLFRNRSIVDWSWAQEPNSVVWAVRDDGVMLSMTYVREQQVFGWAQHNTDGEFESVQTISEEGVDLAYVVVKRTIDGNTKRYIERLQKRDFEKLREAFFVDSGGVYNGFNQTSTTLTLTGGTDWGYPETLTLTASASTFSGGDVGRFLRLYTDDTEEQFAEVEVLAFNSDTDVDVRPVRLVPEGLRGTATDVWALMATTITGLTWLEGKTVSILADGNVSPQRTVSGGEITLQEPAAYAVIGLPITAEIETLPITGVSSQGDTIRDNRKGVRAIGMEVYRSRGIFAGRSRNTTDMEFYDLIEFRQREDEEWAEPTGLATGYLRIPIPSRWDKSGNFVMQQTDPLPLTILNLMPEVTVGGKG